MLRLGVVVLAVSNLVWANPVGSPSLKIKANDVTGKGDNKYEWKSYECFGNNRGFKVRTTEAKQPVAGEHSSLTSLMITKQSGKKTEVMFGDTFGDKWELRPDLIAESSCEFGFKHEEGKPQFELIVDCKYLRRAELETTYGFKTNPSILCDWID